jgi:hypothetical protein
MVISENSYNLLRDKNNFFLLVKVNFISARRNQKSPAQLLGGFEGAVDTPLQVLTAFLGEVD